MSAYPQPTVLQLIAPEAWISQEEFLRLSGWSRRWFFVQVAGSTVRQRPTARTLRNGRTEMEYSVESLPADARARYVAESPKITEAQAKPCEPVSAPPAVPSPIAALLPGPRLVDRTMRLSAPAETLPEAEERHQILEPILAMSDAVYSVVCSDRLRLRDGRRVDSANRMIEYQIEQCAARGRTITARTIKRWLAKYKAAPGVAALAKAKRRDAGRSRWFEQDGHRDAACLVAYLHLGDGILPGLSVQACYDMLREECSVVGLTEDDLPHYDTVRTFLGSITPAMKTFATRGRKEFAERMMPYLSRAYNEHANAIWISDHMIADVEVMNDCIPGAPLGAPIRLRLTAIVDYRSRYILAWSWCWEGSSASIGTALRRAITQHGPCRIFYCDNGKDYLKIAKGAIPGYLRPGSLEEAEWVEREMRSIEQCGILARLGIRATHCIAHHPQSKHVERFFRTVHLSFCKLWPTYTGGKPSERPDQTTALMTVHRRAQRRGDLSQSRHPLASDFIARFDTWAGRYNAKRHGGRGMQGRCPAEVFATEQDPAQRREVAPQDLALLLREMKRCKVRECQVEVNKNFYAPAGDDPVVARTMFDLNEQTVTVAYDKLDPSMIAVLDADGYLLAMLPAKRFVRMAPDDPATQAQIAVMQKMRSGLAKTARERQLGLVREAKQIGVVHPLDKLQPSPTPDLPGVITPRTPRLAAPVTAAEVRAPKYAHEVVLDLLEDA